jgi:hypothetical protein
MSLKQEFRVGEEIFLGKRMHVYPFPNDFANESGTFGLKGLTVTRWCEGSTTRSMSSMGIASSKT